MKAIVYDRYGPPDVLRIEDVERPPATADRVLIKVRAASVNRSDWETLTGKPAYARVGGLRRPADPVLGSDVAGTVEAVGPGVTEFQPGDDVLGDTLYHGHGAFAEYLAVRQGAPLVKKPEGLSFEDAATLPQAAVLGLQGMRNRPNVGPEKQVLVVGAGGGGGTFAIQIAKSLGAEVTGVDSGAKADLMRSLGADHAIDYTQENFTRSGQRYDHIVDFVGARPLFASRRAMRPGGSYLMVGGPVRRLLNLVTLGLVMSWLSSRDTKLLGAKPNKEDLSYLAGLAAAGELRPAIDRTYTLDQVPEALARLGSGEVLGKLVITM